MNNEQTLPEGLQMKKLLPCPFCGCDAILDSDCGIASASYSLDPAKRRGYYVVKDIKAEILNYQVRCSNCGLNVCTGLKRTKKEAVAAWNRRAGKD